MIIHSIESDVKFPDMEYYDMHKPGEMALYLAHSDLFPFRSVIENNKLALDAINETYRNTAGAARLQDDFITESYALTSGLLSTSRVDILTQYSLLITMVSLLEESVNTLCNIYCDLQNETVKLTDVKGNGLERAATYLKKHIGISGFTSDKQWEYITAIRDARNMIVHNGGRLIRDFDKFNKFDIKYREEDNQIYLEYHDIVKMYDAILDFMERSFRLEPK